jgi:hypothetical protein
MKFSKIQSKITNSLATSAMTAQASKSKFVPVLLASGMFLSINSTLPVQAQEVAYNITLTFYEPETAPENSIFVGSFDYDASTHAVTGLQGLLSESMTGPGTTPYNPATGPGVSDGMTWLSLNNQLPNGDASHTYEWHDATLGGTFATVFYQNTSLTFATSYKGATGDGWSPQGGKAVSSRYPTPNNAPNASALIFVPDNLSPANPIDLVWDESTDTGSLGVAHTAYADNTPGGQMGPIGMTGTSAYIYGSAGTMGGVPLSETISAVPEPSTWSLAASATGLLGLLISRKKKS